MKKQNKQFDYEDVVMGLDTKIAFVDTQLSGKDVRIRRLLEAIPKAHGKVLDVGSGGGSITEYLARVYKNASLYGADVSQAAITLANKNRARKAKYGVIQSGVLPYKDNTFDLCVCFDVLEHVADVTLFLSEIRRVLKPRGHFFLAVPCEGQFLSLTWILSRMAFGDKLTYKHVGHIHPEFTHEYVSGLLRGVGFKKLSVSYSEHFLTQCVRFIRFILPKEVLEFVLGSDKASRYYDRSVLRSKPASVKRFDVFMVVRSLWLALGDVFDWIESTEARLFKHSGFAAWKLLILSTNEK